MKLKVLAVLTLLALGSLCSAGDGGLFSYAYDVDVSSATPTYCVATGSGGIPTGDPIKVLGTIATANAYSTTLTEFANTDPFTGVGVGDILLIETTRGVWVQRVVVTATSVSSVVVDRPINLATNAAGHKFSYFDVTCGTGDTNGWVDVIGRPALLTVQYDGGDLTALWARFECKSSIPGAEPVVIYPDDASACGFGAVSAVVTTGCAFATPGPAGRFSVAVDPNLFSACRVGFGYDTADTTDTDAKAAQTFTYNNAVDVTAGKKVVVNGVTYTFKAAVAANYDVKVSGTSDGSFTNLINAIKMNEAPGVGDNKATGLYMVPAINPYATAAINAGTDTVTITALFGGTDGNSLTLSSDEATVTLGGALLASGLDKRERLTATWQLGDPDQN
jgi:hypothetical protein